MTWVLAAISRIFYIGSSNHVSYPAGMESQKWIVYETEFNLAGFTVLRNLLHYSELFKFHITKEVVIATKVCVDLNQNGQQLEYAHTYYGRMLHYRRQHCDPHISSFRPIQNPFSFQPFV